MPAWRSSTSETPATGRSLKILGAQVRHVRRHVSLHDRLLGHDDHFVEAHGCLLYRKVNRGSQILTDVDSLLQRRRVPDERCAKTVRTGAHIQNVIVPFNIGYGALRRSLDGDIHAGKRFPGSRIGYLTSDLALLRPGSSRDKQRKRKQ